MMHLELINCQVVVAVWGVCSGKAKGASNDVVVMTKVGSSSGCNGDDD